MGLRDLNIHFGEADGDLWRKKEVMAEEHEENPLAGQRANTASETNGGNIQPRKRR